jgi:hypothetical protein
MAALVGCPDIGEGVPASGNELISAGQADLGLRVGGYIAGKMSFCLALALATGTELPMPAFVGKEFGSVGVAAAATTAAARRAGLAG